MNVLYFLSFMPDAISNNISHLNQMSQNTGWVRSCYTKSNKMRLYTIKNISFMSYKSNTELQLYTDNESDSEPYFSYLSLTKFFYSVFELTFFYTFPLWYFEKKINTCDLIPLTYLFFCSKDFHWCYFDIRQIIIPSHKTLKITYEKCSLFGYHL